MSDEGQLARVDERRLVQDVPHQAREWTDIGTAEVTLDVFGKAKVHVIHRHDHAYRNAKIAGVCILFAGLALLAYRLSSDNESAATGVPALTQENASSSTVMNAPVLPPAATTSANHMVASAVLPAQPAAAKHKTRHAPVTSGNAGVAPTTPSPSQPVVIPEKPMGEISY